MEPKSSSPQTTRELLKIANSPDGQKLLSLIQERGGAQYNQAMQQAESGDYSGAKEMISKIISSPEAMKLIQKIRGKQ